MSKPARVLTFKCANCEKPVKVFLQKVSACSHIQPYQGVCACGVLKRHATGNKDAVESYLASPEGQWSHHH
ncbi:hypothetical protein LXA47_16905 [Massilia sp. P8910]|uniref:hypothetical protein n=1 Tax=Massilia antarctica TaxID=2765360 RepID=UPI0006BDB76A|nr:MULTISPECIES: hypothetical protein [Massilia]MCE3605271.1 hypothetical protein [Massilia antarctica]MCY0914095.1 hypothetical protein [Massilia sp. H27-R4]CUI08493.1 hypothetical protein BN2497_11763 [Janthinobacterium sp. CG23_2]CUU32279.1 hypothetical protein BN3177_11763 [Janthinobacterium sp. CG23_2]